MNIFKAYNNLTEKKEFYDVVLELDSLSKLKEDVL